MRNVRKDPYAICEQRRPRWACASVQSALDSLCSSTFTTIYIDSVSRPCKPRSACANAQADLGLRCPPLHKDLFRILRIIRNTFDTIGMLCFVITDFAGSLFFLLFVKWISLMFSLHCRLRSLRNLYISLSVRKRTFGYVRPAKIQVSLHIHTVWSEPSLGAFLDSQGCIVSSSGQRRLWSDCADAQAYLSLRWAHVRRYCFDIEALMIMPNVREDITEEETIDNLIYYAAV